MECNVCSEQYNILSNKIPIVLGCGHSLCSRCIEALLIQDCPKCRSPIQSKSKNFALMEMLEKSKKQTPFKGKRKDIEQLFKVSIVGGSSVGKTTILHYITKGEFNANTIPTVGVDFTYIDKQIHSKVYRFQLWDTAGQEQYRCIAKNHYINSDVIILTYSVNELCTFDELEDYWIKEIEQVAPDAKIVIIGNKCDLVKVVPIQRIEQFSKKYNAPHYQVSCKNNMGVLTVWEHIVAYLYKSKSRKQQKKQKDNVRIKFQAQPNKKGFFWKLRECWSFLF